MVNRRYLLGTALAAVAGTGWWFLRPRNEGRIQHLIIDPSGQDLVYRDGWIERL